MAAAALDRLPHNCTVVNISGESFRLKEKRQAARSILDALLDPGPAASLMTDKQTRKEVAG